MIKQGDAVTISRLQNTRRQRTKLDPPGEEWINSKPKMVKSKGVVGSLHAFYLPVTLPDGAVRQIPYADLTFGTDNKASFKSRLPQWKGIKNGEEVIIPGNVITVRGVINPGLLSVLHIPVIVEGEIRQIPFKNLSFGGE